MTPQQDDVMPALLPCPFCGGTDISSEDARDFIGCRTCCAEGPVGLGMGAEHNAAAWNRRASLAAVPVEGQQPVAPIHVRTVIRGFHAAMIGFLTYAHDTDDEKPGWREWIIKTAEHLTEDENEDCAPLIDAAIEACAALAATPQAEAGVPLPQGYRAGHFSSDAPFRVYLAEDLEDYARRYAAQVPPAPVDAPAAPDVEALRKAWDNLPDNLRCHPGLKAYMRAVNAALSAVDAALGAALASKQQEP